MPWRSLREDAISRCRPARQTPISRRYYRNPRTAARRRVGGLCGDEPLALRCLSQRVFGGGAHEIELVAVARRELTLAAAEPRDDQLTTLAVMPIVMQYSAPDGWNSSPFSPL